MIDQSNLSAEEIAAKARVGCIRLWILRLLKASPGHCGNDEFMHTGLSYAGLPLAHAEMLAHLHFLADNGLVRLRYLDDFPFKVWTIELTRAGQEVVQGLTRIDGIELPRAMP